MIWTQSKSVSGKKLLSAAKKYSGKSRDMEMPGVAEGSEPLFRTGFTPLLVGLLSGFYSDRRTRVSQEDRHPRGRRLATRLFIEGGALRF